jgi:hypothetical protein
VDKLVYLALGSLRPAFDRLEFNMAEKMILRAPVLRRGVPKGGDLGELVVKIKQDLRFKIYDLSVKTCMGARENRETVGMGARIAVMRLGKLIRESDPRVPYIVRWSLASSPRICDKTVVVLTAGLAPRSL